MRSKTRRSIKGEVTEEAKGGRKEGRNGKK
jgi:hypothetical protein